MPELIYSLSTDEDGKEETIEMLIFEANQKCWLNNVSVKTEDGNFYSVVFITPWRIQQYLENKSYHPVCFAHPGLIVVKEITQENLQNAVDYAWEIGYFSSLKPLE